MPHDDMPFIQSILYTGIAYQALENMKHIIPTTAVQGRKYFIFTKKLRLRHVKQTWKKPEKTIIW